MAYVKSGIGYSSGPIVLNSITAGSTLVAYVSGDSSLATTTLPSPWVKQTPVATSGAASCIWVYYTHAGGNLSSAITNPPGDPGWSIHEYSGRDTTAPVEDESTNTGSSTTWASAAVTATTGADVFAGVGQETAAFTVTYTSPFTRRTLQSDHVHATGDDDNVTAGNITAGGNIAAVGVNWTAGAVSLKAAGGGAVQLVVANATHAHTAANTALTQHQVLSVAAATSAHTAANVALTQHQALTVAGAVHGHTAAATVLVQHHTLIVAGATHGHTAAAVALTQHQVLAVADAGHGHTAEPVTLTQHHTLTVADAAHQVVSDNVTLGVAGVLGVQDATHAHTAANVTLGIGGVSLTVADTTHGHSVAAVAVVQHHTLELVNATHVHTVVNVALLQHFVLVVADAVHAHRGGVVLFTVPPIGGTGTGGITSPHGGVVGIVPGASAVVTVSQGTGTGDTT